MLRKQSNDIEWLEFELLADCKNLDHGVFLRHGGTSSTPYHSLNLGLSTKDDPQSVKNNLSSVAKLFKTNHLYGVRQVHGKDVHIVEKGDTSFPFADAIATNHPDHALIIKHADCQSAILYDPIHHALTSVHSGWRGSVANIYDQAVSTMKETYNSKPQDIIACIGPSLGPDHAQFIHYKKELPESFWSYQTRPNYFDFWTISYDQLISCGILPHHIEIAKICTYANEEDFFSYRHCEPTGRHGTVAVLR